MLNLSDSAKAIRSVIAKSPHSRLPVYETDPDHVLGVIQAKDLLHSYISRRRLDVRNAIRPAPLIPIPSMLAMWFQFLRRRLSISVSSLTNTATLRAS